MNSLPIIQLFPSGRFVATARNDLTIYRWRKRLANQSAMYECLGFQSSHGPETGFESSKTTSTKPRCGRRFRVLGVSNGKFLVLYSEDELLEMEA